MAERLQFPITVKLEVHITDGEQVGSANYSHGHGSLPTEEEMSGILKKVVGALPAGFRLMNRAESSMHYLREERGYRGPNMVIPRSGQWHDPDADTDYAGLGSEPDLDEDEE